MKLEIWLLLKGQRGRDHRGVCKVFLCSWQALILCFLIYIVTYNSPHNESLSMNEN
jgi:hypothetical protein